MAPRSLEIPARVRCAVPLLVLAAACATARTAAPPSPGPAPQPPPPAAKLDFEPQPVEVSPLDLELQGKNDEELFAVGTAAFSTGDYRRAAAAFGRLADLHPTSRHEAAALYDAGLAHERLEEWRPALERFRALERRYVGPDAVEASFRTAECLYHLRALGDARAVLDRLAAREELGDAERIRALTQRGVVELEDGKLDDAEKSLRLALSRWQEASERERLDDYYPAQAQFYLGEVYREAFQALHLDPSAGDEAKLGRELEEKAEMLLSAQGHYLRAIRMGNADWAVASGSRIGELYDELYRELTEAPLPPGLDPEHAAAYRSELRKKVRVLVTKAIAIYERTLATAERARVENNKFVDRTQASLERMKRALLDGGEAPPGPAPALPPDAGPDPGAAPASAAARTDG